MSIVGIGAVAMESWGPPPGSPATEGTEARGETRGEPAGTAPTSAAAGRLSPVLLATELPREPVILSKRNPYEVRYT